MPQPGSGKFDAAALRQFGIKLLTAAGLALDRARDVAEVLLEGDLLGHNTHGFALLPKYLQALQDGSMEKNGEPLVIADHDSALTWDGRYLPGPWLTRRAIAEAQLRTAKHPVVTVVINHSHHIGCLEAYSNQSRTRPSRSSYLFRSCQPHSDAARRLRATLQPQPAGRRHPHRHRTNFDEHQPVHHFL